MSAVATAANPEQGLEERAAPSSPAGPVDPGEAIRRPPAMSMPSALQTLMFGLAPMEFNLRASRELGDVWQISLSRQGEPFAMTCHPEHVKSLFTADPKDAPWLTGETPLRPILGRNPVLTMVGERHLRERKLLLPPFHGEAVKRYVGDDLGGREREIEGWPVGRAVRPRTADAGRDARGDHERPVRDRWRRRRAAPPEYRMRETFRRLLGIPRTSSGDSSSCRTSGARRRAG